MEKKKSHHKKITVRYERNYALLNFLNKRGLSQKWIAELLGVTAPTVLYKIKHVTEFRTIEIAKIRDALKLTPQEVNYLFLTFVPIA